jgi:hypothetical protein
LMHAVATAASLDDCASAFRYPRGEVLAVGRGRVLREGGRVCQSALNRDPGSGVRPWGWTERAI